MLEIRRREFIATLGGAAAWPLAARAQQRALPVIGFLGSESPDLYTGRLRAFHQGLRETGFVEGRKRPCRRVAERSDEFAPPDFEHRLPSGQNYRNWGALSPSVRGSKDTTPRGGR